VQAGRTAVHEARAHRCEYVRRDEVARGVRQAGTGVASRRQARGARVSQAIENASKTMACNVNSVLQVTGKGAQNKARLAVRLLTRAGFSRAQPETRAGVYAFHAKRQVLCPPYDP
jgi:hypothetical protein